MHHAAVRQPLDKRTMIQLNQDQHEWLRASSFERRTSIARIVRDLIDAARGVTPEEGPARTHGQL